MSREEVIETVNGFLAEEFEVEVESLDPNGALHETLDLDSLDYVDLVVVIESHFGFKVTGEDFKSMSTLNDFYDFIVNKFEHV